MLHRAVSAQFGCVRVCLYDENMVRIYHRRLPKVLYDGDWMSHEWKFLPVEDDDFIDETPFDANNEDWS